MSIEAAHDCDQKETTKDDAWGGYIASTIKQRSA